MDSTRHTHAHAAYTHTRAIYDDADSDPSQTQTPNLNPQTFHLKTVDIRFDFANSYFTRAKGRAAHSRSAAANNLNY